jgi:diadenosine tetraphosphate (Ap4A) HIT family hydrolase
MPSRKPIYKKPYEKVDHYEESVWLSNDTPIFETEFTAVFRDRYPCVEGHTLFIPKKDTPEYVGKSYELAYQTAQDWVAEGIMAGFNVGMNIGNCAGQTIYWPHIHLIPRHEGDADKKGGMRYAHPGADHYEYYSEEDTYEKD